MAVALEQTVKRCRSCDQERPIGEFWRNSGAKDGLQSYCKTCSNNRRRSANERWTPEQRERHRQRVIKYRYGVGLDLVDALYERQEACCAICGKAGDRPFVKEKRSTHKGVLCIDHDHKTGEVRGLLCTNCNVGLGRFSDDIPTMARAMAYIAQNGVM